MADLGERGDFLHEYAPIHNIPATFMGFEWACTLTTIAFRLHVRSKAQGIRGKSIAGCATAMCAISQWASGQDL